MNLQPWKIGNKNEVRAERSYLISGCPFTKGLCKSIFYYNLTEIPV